jgi:outer membrane protein OmpA-like peptidoglycan-associated protein
MLSLLSLALLTPPSAHAAGGDFLITTDGGWVIIDESDSLGSTWTGGLRLGHGLGDFVSFEIAAHYLQGTSRVNWECGGQTCGNYLYDAVIPTADLVFNLVRDFPIQPTFAIGGGIIYKEVRADRKITEENPNYEGWKNFKNPDIDAAFNAGIGLNIQLFGPVWLRSDFRYLMTAGGQTESVDGNQDLYSDWIATGGLLFKAEWFFRDSDGDGIIDRLDECPEEPEDYDTYLDKDGCPDTDNDRDGILDANDQCMHDPEDFDEWEDKDGCPDFDNDGDGWADTEDRCPNKAEDKDGFKDDDGCPEGDNDGDGVPDFDDKCPNHPEDKDGFEDEDGCPEGDNDSDGIADHLDDCPKDPEDLDGFQDEDGCPEVDNDGDAIADIDDECPNHPEDIDLFEDEDGCPDEDNDGDQIPDTEDQCPNQAEIINGITDEDGCPDEIPEEVKRFTGVIHGIHFKTNSDELKLSSLPLLDEAAKVLLEFTAIRLEVGGHTDSDGSEEYNLDLSARRAGSVVNYFIKKGVEASRLEWVGHGEARPIHPNDSEDQKEANRRVEFRILNTAEILGE